MADVVLVRPEDHLIVGVRWSGFTVSGTGAAARLTAGAQARLVILLPPQHIGEGSSLPTTPAPHQLPIGSGGMVPAWRGVLSAPTRLTFNVAADTQIPLTAEGMLAAILNNPLVVAAGVPGPEDTAIELPWRLVIAPRGRSAAGTVVCRHPTRPGAATANGLWRTRLVDPAAAANTPLPDAGLTLTVADRAIAETTDPALGPNNSLPLDRSERGRLVHETARRPARLSRLELSALGGTLDALGTFETFEWEHHAVLGRDMYVRTVANGAMYPLGHRAQYLEVAERIYDPTAGGAAVLRLVSVLTIVEPVRPAPGDGPIRRAFPLGDVEITRTVFTDVIKRDPRTTVFPGVGPLETHFWPATRVGSELRDVRFPVACTTSSGVVKFDLPLVFVNDLRPTVDSLGSPILADRLATDYGNVAVRIDPANIDLVGAASDQRANGDVQEVHALTIAGATRDLNLAGGYRPRLSQLDVALPALRALRDDDVRTHVAFASAYLRHGASEDVLLEMLPGQAVPIDFTKAADRSGGLVAPKYKTDAISRTSGPVDLAARPNPATGIIDPERLFPSDEATLLGFPLRLLLTQLKSPPEMTYTPFAGSAPEVRMVWRDVKLKQVGPFKPNATTRLKLTVTTAPNSAATECVVNDFALELPPGAKPSLRLSFRTLKFSQHDGKSPDVAVEGVHAEFLGSLKFVEKLSSAVNLGAASKLIGVTPTGITVRHSLTVPELSSGVFVMRNIAFISGIEVPFDGNPLSIVLGFSTRANPFQLSVMMFGGGGYVELTIDRDGLKRFEAALEFGALIAVNFVVASGEVHALGGVRFVLEGGEVTVAGYLRIGGCVEVLGLISVSIELCLTLSYQSDRNALVGRATLVIEIDLTLWSDSVEIDSGEWVLPGTGRDRQAALGVDEPPLLADDGFALWKQYRAAFAPDDARDPAIARALRDPAGTSDTVPTS